VWLVPWHLVFARFCTTCREVLHVIDFAQHQREEYYQPGGTSYWYHDLKIESQPYGCFFKTESHPLTG
jgi:hypothetical protein